jgi:hypothetical protein
MLNRICLPALACGLVVSLAGRAGESKAVEDASEMKVRLRLNAIESAKLQEHYERLVKRELELEDGVRACRKSGDGRLPEYLQALQEAQGDLEKTKKKLVALESERDKVLRRLATKNRQVASPEPARQADRILEKILERLDSIEKRLQKLERAK